MRFTTCVLAFVAAAQAQNTSVCSPEQIAVNEFNYGSCANANWPPASVGEPIVPPRPSCELQAALAEVDVDNIKAIILKLVSFGTRHTLSTQTDPNRGIGAARDWIAAELQRYANASEGRMTVEVQGYVQPIASRIPFPVRISNVLATINGTTNPDKVYVVSGHYDSRVTDVLDYESDSPGANDDASGVAVAMELARIFAKRRPSSTVVFTAVAGEEQSLFGSNFQAQTYKNASVNVEGMLNNDIIGSSIGSRGEKEPNTVRLFCQGPPSSETTSQAATRLTIGGENDSPARQLGRYVAEVAANKFTEMRVAIVYRLDRYLRGGDHRSYLEAGYAAVRFTEPNEDYDHQHQDVRVEDGVQIGDLPEYVDYAYVARVAKVNLAALWSLAESPGKVRNVTVNASLLSNDSQFSWAALSSPNLKGYEIVWRPTNAPQWTHSLYVGNVLTATVPLSKDNVVFGVRAVSNSGYKSPAVLPFPR